MMKKSIYLFVLMLGVWSSAMAVTDVSNSGEFTNTIASGPLVAAEISSPEGVPQPGAAYSCTLKAELSYKGVSVKVSITADTCTEAGAGLADVTTAFYFRVLQMANN